MDVGVDGLRLEAEQQIDPGEQLELLSVDVPVRARHRDQELPDLPALRLGERLDLLLQAGEASAGTPSASADEP